MNRYIFSVSTSGETKLIDAEVQKALMANYASLDPSFSYFRRIQWTLDADDVANIRLIEQNDYKDPKSALAKKFISSAKATAAGLAEIFARPGFIILYVCIEVFAESYQVTVLQDGHPRAISGSRELMQAPLIRADLGMAEIKSKIATIARPLKERLTAQKAQAVAAISGGGMDM
jgi:hypothetical protein